MTGPTRRDYIRMMHEQTSLYECYARQRGLQGKALQILLWLTYYPQETGRDLTQKWLAQRTYSTKQVVNATIKTWQAQGYVILLENPRDKRHKLVRLTEVGHAFAQGIVQPLHQMEAAALSVLTPDERAVLSSLTARYNLALKAEMEANDD